jgi:hypothetical protein
VQLKSRAVNFAKKQKYLKSPRFRWSAAAIAAAIAIFYGQLRQRENHGHRPQYGDVATWLTFVIAVPGIVLAFWQLHHEIKRQNKEIQRQNEEFSNQLNRQALTDQLLTARLEQIRRDQAAALRRQANLVTQSTAPDEPPGALGPDGEVIETPPRLVARVVNRSARPIRNVRCILRDPATGRDLEPYQAGEYMPFAGSPDGEPHTLRPFTVQQVPVLQAGVSCGFVFNWTADHRPAEVSVMFTDDEDLSWRIDHEHRLHKIDPTVD